MLILDAVGLQIRLSSSDLAASLFTTHYSLLTINYKLFTFLLASREFLIGEKYNSHR